MPNTDKSAAVAEITESFNSASAAVITEYRGLSVKQITQLRRALGRDTTYAVVKNTLTKRAAAEAGVPIDDSLLTGPTAIAFVKGDPVEAAKGLRDFAKTTPLLVIKGGILDGKAINKSGFGTSDLSLPRQLENIERSIIEDALRRKQGDVQSTATLLGIPKQTLYDKIKRLAVNVDGIREGAIVRTGV